MKIEQFLKRSEIQLTDAGIGSARLDVLILLEDSLHKDRSWLLANPERELTQLQVNSLGKKLNRRAKHEPLAYIRGHSEFYGRKFKVNRHTLEPRPESETMITLLKQTVDSGQLIVNSKNESINHKLKTKNSLSVADVGTGSGCLGITAKLEMPELEVDLYDISASALAVAKHNAHMHELHLHGRKMNLLSRPLRPYDIILANLPYVPTDWQINKAAMNEPRMAIFGGQDGLDIYRKLFVQLNRFIWKPDYIFTESMPPQHQKLAEIAKESGFKLHKSEDFIQVFRAW